jgi:phage shock protein C
MDCWECTSRQSVIHQSIYSMNLYRSSNDRQIAGVCGGLANHFGLSSTRIRIVWLLATIFSAGFPGVILYLVLWFLLPEEPAAPWNFEPPS